MKWPRRTTDPVPGHGYAWTGFVVGIVASIAANVLHAMEGTWSYPELVGAAFWPTALLISVEILTRVAWPHGWRWFITRSAGVLVVAAVAAALSYLHMRSLLLSWGEGRFQATIGPAAVDGLMLISATALLAVSRIKNTPAPAAVPVSPLEQPVPLGIDQAGRQIATAILAHMPKLPELPEPIVRGKSVAIRIPLGGRRTRPGRLAGHRRLTVVPPLEAAPHHPAPPPPPRNVVPADVNGTLVLPSGTTYTPPGTAPGTAALNGATSTRTTAPMNGATKAKKPTRRGKKAAGSGDAFDRAFRYYQSEQAAGRTPSARDLAAAVGVSSATGGRYLQKLQAVSS